MSLIKGIKSDFGSVTFQKSAGMTQVLKRVLLNNSNTLPISLELPQQCNISLEILNFPKNNGFLLYNSIPLIYSINVGAYLLLYYLSYVVCDL